MNYPYPYLIPGSQVDPTTFAANSTLILGSFSKGEDMVAGLSVDYSQLSVAFIPQSFSFKVKPGGEPQLLITNPLLTDEVLTFTVSGGIAGRAYEVTVNMRGAAGNLRSDVLTINVLGDDCGCTPVLPYYPLGYDGTTSGDGSVIVNDRPRFFVSNTFPVNPNVLDRWYDTTTGSIYDYVSNGLETYWQITGTGGGGGGGGGSGANIVSISPITPDGTTTTFALTSSQTSVSIINANTLFVSVDGVWQQPDVSYAAAGNLVQFTTAPFADSHIFMLWFAPPLAGEP